jgi:hypothetical protein
MIRATKSTKGTKSTKKKLLWCSNQNALDVPFVNFVPFVAGDVR